MRHLAAHPHAVYVIWRHDVALYVGMTSDWETRISQHRRRFFVNGDSTHADVWHVGNSREEAEAIEADTIRDLDPLHNVAHSPRAEREAAAWVEECATFAAVEDPDAWARKVRAVKAAAS